MHYKTMVTLAGLIGYAASAAIAVNHGRRTISLSNDERLYTKSLSLIDRSTDNGCDDEPTFIELVKRRDKQYAVFSCKNASEEEDVVWMVLSSTLGESDTLVNTVASIAPSMFWRPRLFFKRGNVTRRNPYMIRAWSHDWWKHCNYVKPEATVDKYLARFIAGEPILCSTYAARYVMNVSVYDERGAEVMARIAREAATMLTGVGQRYTKPITEWNVAGSFGNTGFRVVCDDEHVIHQDEFLDITDTDIMDLLGGFSVARLELTTDLVADRYQKVPVYCEPGLCALYDRVYDKLVYIGADYDQ